MQEAAEVSDTDDEDIEDFDENDLDAIIGDAGTCAMTP